MIPVLSARLSLTRPDGSVLVVIGRTATCPGCRTQRAFFVVRVNGFGFTYACVARCQGGT